MEKIKEKINKFLDNGRGAILAIFILELILTFFVTPNKFDDEYFLEQVTNNSCLSFVMSRYSWWSSRVIIEFILCAVLKTSRIFCLLSPNTSRTIIPHNGEIIQKSKIHPMVLRPRFLAIFAGRKI